MLDDFGKQINDTFMLIYDSVHKVEEAMLKSSTLDLSISELDIVETIGTFGDKGCSISDIAHKNEVTLPTVTVAIKRLEKKGYVEKARSSEDGRMVNIVLTRIGKKADAAHRYFHERMVRALLKDASEEVRPVILQSLQNLGAFLKQMGEAQL